MSNTIPTWVLLATWVASGFIYAQFMNYHDEEIDRQQYCEMVQLWEADSRLPPEDCRGWPPYKGKEVCDGAQ